MSYFSISYQELFLILEVAVAAGNGSLLLRRSNYVHRTTFIQFSSQISFQMLMRIMSICCANPLGFQSACKPSNGRLKWKSNKENMQKRTYLLAIDECTAYAYRKPSQSVQLKAIHCDAKTTQGYDICETFDKLKGAKRGRKLFKVWCVRELTYIQFLRKLDLCRTAFHP